MEKVRLKYENLVKAIDSFKNAITLYQRAKDHVEIIQLRGMDNEQEVIFEYEPILLAARDSLIQRFEYTVDLLWKYLKLYLEKVAKAVPEVRGPKHIIRHAASIGLISERDAQTLLEMIDSRNMTSHIYKEEIAQSLSSMVPAYYDLIHRVLDKVSPK